MLKLVCSDIFEELKALKEGIKSRANEKERSSEGRMKKAFQHNILHLKKKKKKVCLFVWFIVPYIKILELSQSANFQQQSFGLT